MSDIIVARNIETITTEIKTIEGQVAKAAIYGCIEIGKRLVEAKEMVGHGNWGKYLEEKVRYSQQWATNLMNLYREYGSTQESLFENFANSQSFGKIDVTKHILLLGVPAEEREAFATEHDAENTSTRELQAAIRERDEARQAGADLEKQLDAAGDKLAAKDAELEQLRSQAKAAMEKQAEAEKKVETLKKKVTAANDAEAKAKKELSEAKANPEIPERMMEEMRQQVAADAAAKATVDLQKQLTEAQEQAAKAVKERQAAEEKLVAAQKAVQLANPDAAVFKLLFTQVQNDFIELQRTLLNVQQNDPATGQKLKAAMVTLLDKMKSDLAG